MKIKALQSRYDMSRGEGPAMLVDSEAWYSRDPFEDIQVEGVSPNLLMDPNGTTDGHNLAYDTTFVDSMGVDKYVPLAPLFVKDLAGRTVYIGYGPDRKTNAEWATYIHAEGTVQDTDQNPFIPLCTFPRFCRDVSQMEGRDLLEQVFLTKFRCLEMSLGFNGMLSGADPNDDYVAATYMGANLYPYKLRLDTFYVDGYKLPQVNMVFARGEAEGVNPVSARTVGDELLTRWEQREPGVTYEAWLEAMGEGAVERMYSNGCTLIPTFEACNGYHVVGPNFELEDYWPGRAIMGLHDVVEARSDKAPMGTILEVIDPGYVTTTHVHTARVIVSDGTGYVSPNTNDPEPLVPNLNLPHQRTSADWRATWIPTHPEHFEAPAIWGWDVVTGRFLQISGPLWDPLHYYYESVQHVLAAFDATPLENRVGLVPVPEHMEGRFFPVVPMTGFDTFSMSEATRRLENNLLPMSCLKYVPMPTEIGQYSCGLGYHPMPAEFEFELDVFWFPEFHPLNRDQGPAPQDVDERIVPIISPKVAISTFVPTVDRTDEAAWLNDESLLFTQRPDPLENYPQLTRYLLDDMPADDVVKLCPTPFLNDLGDMLNHPAPAWWIAEDGIPLDEPFAIEELVPGVTDALWDVRQKGVMLVQFRHLVYRENLPLYMLAWWFGWSIEQLEEAMTEWLKNENLAPPSILDQEDTPSEYD